MIPVDQRSYCRCGQEVRLVRLNRSLLAFGHVRNPKSAHHPVRLARPASDSLPGEVRARTEGPESGSGLPGSARPRPAESASESGPSLHKAARKPVRGRSLPLPTDLSAPPSALQLPRKESPARPLRVSVSRARMTSGSPSVGVESPSRRGR